jgi:hypothetical protein
VSSGLIGRLEEREWVHDPKGDANALRVRLGMHARATKGKHGTGNVSIACLDKAAHGPFYCARRLFTSYFMVTCHKTVSTRGTSGS